MVTDDCRLLNLGGGAPKSFIALIMLLSIYETQIKKEQTSLNDM